MDHLSFPPSESPRRDLRLGLSTQTRGAGLLAARRPRQALGVNPVGIGNHTSSVLATSSDALGY